MTLSGVAWSALPWVRASQHVGQALASSRAAHLVAALVFTSLPVAALFSYAFSATWISCGCLLALFLLTLADLNPKWVSVYFLEVPPKLYDLGFRRSLYTKTDGSCFFHAVSQAVGEPEALVRRKIAQWIKGHKTEVNIAPTYQSQSQNFNGDYEKAIRESDLDLWGDTLEAMAVASCWNARVTLYSSEEAIVTFNEESSLCIDLYFTPLAVGDKNPNHYRLLRRSIF